MDAHDNGLLIKFHKWKTTCDTLTKHAMRKSSENTPQNPSYTVNLQYYLGNIFAIRKLWQLLWKMRFQMEK